MIFQFKALALSLITEWIDYTLSQDISPLSSTCGEGKEGGILTHQHLVCERPPFLHP